MLFCSVSLNFLKGNETIMYHQQQNKWFPPKRCLLDQFEATFAFSCSEFTCP